MTGTLFRFGLAAEPNVDENIDAPFSISIIGLAE